MKLNWHHDYTYRESTDRETFKASIFEDYGDFEKVPRQIDAFIDFVAKIRDSIPVEHRGNAVITLTQDADECGYRADFEIYTTRLETDAEYAERKAKEEAEESAAERRAARAQRTLYETLKKKYEKGNDR
jgi:hypothetical protein